MFKILAVTVLFTSATLGDWITPNAADEYELVPLTRSKRLWNGTSVTIEEFPYQVLLFEHGGKKLSSDPWFPFCNGAIISSYWVLTVAHCVEDKHGEYSVRAGSAQRLDGGTHHKADTVVLHPDYLKYADTEFRDDIALVHVETPFEFDTTRQPAALFDPDEESKPGTNLVLTGWGDINESDSPKAQVLQRIALPIMTKDECRSRFKNRPGLIVNLDNVICAGYEDGRQTGCHGDSGNPVTVNGRLAGLEALGQFGCVNSTIPVVITEIAKYRHWIRENSGI